MSTAATPPSSVVAESAAPSDRNILIAASSGGGVGGGHPYPMELQKQALNSLLDDSENADFDARHILGYKDGLSKLQEITATRILDYQNHVMNNNTNNNSNNDNNCPSMTQLEQQALAFRQEHGPVLNLQTVIQAQSPRMALAAEFKRASPSKGPMDAANGGSTLQAGQQACLYTKAGANIISILTEPHWFRGSLQDMRDARLETAALVAQMGQQQQQQKQRPAILRKCFITNEYMIAEAAAHGADTILLIVAVLPQHLLQRLIHYSRNVLQMEPLVEVHAPEELQVALQAGAKVIGVNNRNLHTFQVDLETTQRTARAMKEQGYTYFHHDDPCSNDGNGVKVDYTICALSGMSTAHDVHLNRQAGVGMCLIGESLMRAIDPVSAIQSLCLDPNDYYYHHHHHSNGNGNTTGDNNSATTGAASGGGGSGAAYTAGTKIVKICGITTPDDALQACRAGANLIGIIFAEKSKRKIPSQQQAREIVDAVRKYGERQGRVSLSSSSSSSSSSSPRVHLEQCSRTLAQVATSRCPLVVGVFQNQDMVYIHEMVETCGLDLVQLHGQEGFAAASQCSVPAIRVVDIPVDVNDDNNNNGGKESNEKAVQQILEQLTCDPIAILLDTAIQGQHGGGGGGTSTVFDWTIAQKIQNAGVPVLLAGGLSPANIQDCIVQIQPFGVDVSSGVEESPGIKNHEAISSFVTTARRAAQKAQEGF